MEVIRSDFAGLARDDANVLCSAGGEVAWWVFAGGRANAALADELGRRLDMRVTSDNFMIRFPPRQPLGEIEPEIRHLAAVDPRSVRAPVSEATRDGLKFGECLPVELANRVIEDRLGDAAGIAGCLSRPTRTVLHDQV